MAKRKPNVVLIGIDSLRADHMSLYGYSRLTTPHIDRLAQQGTVFENAFSPHIPTTPGYGSMLTGRDCFGTSVVSLRHEGPMADGVPTLSEILRREGYETTCIGFPDSAAARGFDNFLEYVVSGTWSEGCCPKAERMNELALPELRRLARLRRPFFLFMRHMDPHSPYLPPGPYERMFYGGNEFDPSNRSMEPVFGFKPLADYQASWLPPGLTDKDYVIAQYDGAIAYMDACIQNILTEVTALGLDQDTLIVIVSDHGETLYDHECWFDHHGLYECTLRVPLLFRMPGRVPAGLRLPGNTTLQDITPTILDVLGVKTKTAFDGQSLLPEMRGRRRTPTAEFYITECTWMRKHGWRTSQWKLIRALEPDFHFKPEVELYDLIEDPEESRNLARKEKKVAAMLEDRMLDWIARREKETGRTNPMYTNLHWHGAPGMRGPFGSSQQAYDVLRVTGARGTAVPRSRLEMLQALGYA